MAASTKAPKVLVLGLKEGGQYDAATIQRVAGEQMAQIKEAGIDVHALIIDLKDLHDALWDQIYAKLGEQQQWDGVVIGFGIRGNPSLTVLFEKIVNTCVQEFNISRFGFNSKPGDTAEAVIRGFSA